MPLWASVPAPSIGSGNLARNLKPKSLPVWIHRLHSPGLLLHRPRRPAQAGRRLNGAISQLPRLGRDYHWQLLLA
jgi:hypothetical protein